MTKDDEFHKAHGQLVIGVRSQIARACHLCWSSSYPSLSLDLVPKYSCTRLTCPPRGLGCSTPLNMSTGSIQTNRWAPSVLSPVRILLVSIALGALFKFWPLSPESEDPPESQTQSDRFPHSPPVSYRPNTEVPFASFSLLHVGSVWEPAASPDTTAVVLNWSRFHNVQRIASLFCSPGLHGTIKEVFIWNNNPKAISYHVGNPLCFEC